MKYRVTADVSVAEGLDPINVGDVVELPEGTVCNWAEPVEDAAPKKRSTKKAPETASVAPEVETATTA